MKNIQGDIMPSPIGAMPLQGVQSHIVFKISVPAQLEPLLTPPHLLDDPQALNGFLSNIRGGGGPQGLSVFGGEAQFRKPVKNTQNIPQGLHCSEADKDGFFIPVDNDFVLNIAGDQIPLKYGDIIDRVEGQIVRVRFTSDREVILKNGIKIQCSHKLPLEIDTYGVKKFTTAHAVSLSLSEDIGAEIAPDYVVEMNAARLVNKFWMASSRSEHKDCFMDVLGFRVVVDGAGLKEIASIFV
ncbi:MAG: hypothetical protein IPJ69_13260 [Deltaproteobacteria bacterium]|nr:MAG: hypothetical protein IPJ69_13260 [Deltaproteobacteria bacterium]